MMVYLGSISKIDHNQLRWTEGQWYGVLMVSSLPTRTNSWTDNSGLANEELDKLKPEWLTHMHALTKQHMQFVKKNVSD